MLFLLKIARLTNKKHPKSQLSKLGGQGQWHQTNRSLLRVEVWLGEI